MYEQRPVRRAETIGAQCPVRRCGGCGREEAVAEGTAVPLALFRAREGDAAPEAGAGAGAAGAAGDGPKQASPDAPAGGAAGDDGAVNDIPDDANAPFRIRLPRKGWLGASLRMAVLPSTHNRLTLRRNRDAAGAGGGGARIPAGQTSKIVRSAGKALSPALMMAIVALQAAKMPRIDKTAYWINGIMCSLWVSCDPQRNIAAYRVGRAGDTDVVERV